MCAVSLLSHIIYTKDDSDKAGFRIEITCNVQDINMKDSPWTDTHLR